MNKRVKYYSPLEEKINIYSHALGFILSVIGLFFLILKSSLNGTVLHIISASVFGISLIILYAASTAYHRTQQAESRIRLRVFDHASIYVLIAGTYTPFTLITLTGFTGWVIFGVTWSMALAGIILKLFFTGKYSLLSTLMYVFMGWIIIFAISPLLENLSAAGMFWLSVGGASYTIGAVLYAIKKIKFNHAIFHVFVLLGSVSHFIAVYFYVL